MDGILQQFHLVIRYKKGIYNRVADMLSILVINVAILLKSNSAFPESNVEQYAQDADFQEVYLNLSQGHQVEELDYHVHDNLLYHLGKLCGSTRRESKCHKGITHFSYCWTFRCK